MRQSRDLANVAHRCIFGEFRYRRFLIVERWRLGAADHNQRDKQQQKKCYRADEIARIAQFLRQVEISSSPPPRLYTQMPPLGTIGYTPFAALAYVVMIGRQESKPRFATTNDVRR
jgi:hypothetical protein